MRVEARAAIERPLDDAHRWSDVLMRDSESTVQKLVHWQSKSERSICTTLSQAFVAPPIIDAAIKRRLPRGFGVIRLMDLQMEWLKQWRAHGFRPPDRLQRWA
jgi:hypothetical protein